MITVIGLDGSPLAAADSAALAAATLVVGGRRHLAAAPPRPGAAVIELGALEPALTALACHRGDAVVLASGDPGFFGILRSLRERGLACAVRPAVSSVALAFGRAGLPWDDAQVVSAHGRDPRRAINVCRAHPKVAVLTGPGCGPAELGAALEGWQRRLVVAEHLGTPAERVTSCTAREAATRHWDHPNVVIVIADRPLTSASGSASAPTSASGSAPTSASGSASAPTSGSGSASAPMSVSAAGSGSASVPGWQWPASAAHDGWALQEDDFCQTDAVITKAEVRALALARLAPAPGRLIWDVGAGTGSVGIECARLGAAVVAIERDPRRVWLIRDNSKRHGVDVRVIEGEVVGGGVVRGEVVRGEVVGGGVVGGEVVEGEAPGAAEAHGGPDALSGLPTPDAVFIGGGGTSAVEAVIARQPTRIVVALAAVDRVAPACAVLGKAGYTVDGTLLQAARLSPLPGGVHRFDAVNPVFVLWATRMERADGPQEAAPPRAGGAW